MSKLLFLIAFISCSFSPLARQDLEMQYNEGLLHPSDINEHMPHLKRLAAECSSVVEIGLRDMVSSWGLLLGLAENGSDVKSYLGIDLNYPPPGIFERAKTLSQENGINFAFWQMNDMDAELEPMDLLFIDAMHTYCHVTYELEKFAPKAKKYIALHDTSEPWGNLDLDAYAGDYSEYPKHIDRTKRGVWPAVEDFLKTHPEWSLQARYLNNHGFTILKRNVSMEAQIERALKNKIILCTGPSLGRKEWLKRHTEADATLIPFKKIFLTTNDPKNLDIAFSGKAPISHLIPERGHQLDCLNCILSSIKNAALDPASSDDDIILFKHESLFINDMHLVKQAIRKLLEGYDVVVRYWAPDGFYMANVFYIKVAAAREAFKDLTEIAAFNEDFRFCEDFLTKYVFKRVPKIYRIDYSHLTRKDTELGLFHVPPPGEENREGYWDKRNYNSVF